MLVEALADAEAADLLRQLLGAVRLSADSAARILDVAEGNPLFVVEVVEMLIDDDVVPVDDGRAPVELTAIAVPPTIQALLAARLDRLAVPERAVIEAASIVGNAFAPESVVALVDDGAGDAIAAQLEALVRKDLIRPAGTGNGAFRFDHQLIRDAAYDGMSKELRADLHERLADWLQAQSSAADELLGYHLERAVMLRRELGETGATTAPLAARAAWNLSTAGRRAAQRDDQAAASALLERASLSSRPTRARAVRCCPSSAPRCSRRAAWPTPPACSTRRSRARRRRGSRRARASSASSCASKSRRVWGSSTPSTSWTRSCPCSNARATSMAGAGPGRCGRRPPGWRAVDRADAAWGEAAACARRAGDERELFAILGWRATAAVFGPTPVGEAIRRCEELRDLVGASPVALAWAVNALALLYAMSGDFGPAEQLLEQANETIHQLGSLHSSVSHIEALVRLLADEPALAERTLRAGVRALASMTDRAMLATTTAMLAQAVYAQGRMGEADELCRAAAEAGAADDIVTQVIWRGVRAKVLAQAGRCEEAAPLAREAVALVRPTDLLSHHGDAMLDLAEVLRACGCGEDSQRAVRSALSLYEQKGNAPGAARARSLLSNRGGRA